MSLSLFYQSQIAEVLTGEKAGQYVWAYAIGSLIEEVEQILEEQKDTDIKIA